MSAGRRPVATAIALALVVVPLFGSLVPSVRAAGEIEQLPGRTLAAAGFDLDGDGDHELVRFLEVTADGGVELDAWDVVDASWAPIVEPIDGRPGLGPTEAGASVVGRFMTWRLDGRERLLVVSSHTSSPESAPENCCLTLGEVRLGRDGLVLEPMPAVGFEAAQFLRPLDVDADGTDELLVQTFGFSRESIETKLVVARWDGGGFTAAYSSTDGRFFLEGVVGETDGVEGDDLLIGSAEDGGIERMTWRDGRMVTEGWTSTDSAYPIGIVDGNLLVQGEGLRLMNWPRDGQPAVVATSSVTASGTAFVATSGDDVAIVVPALDFLPGGRMSSVILGADLERIGDLVIPETQPIWDLAVTYVVPDNTLFPYLGTFPLRGGEAEVWQAGIVVGAGGDGGYRLREASPFVGIVPIAVVGPDDGWIAAGSVNHHMPPGAPAYLFGRPGADADAAGLRLLPRDLLDGFEPEPGSVDVLIDGALEAVGDDGERQLTAGRDGFVATVTAPPGTAVVVVNDGSAEVTNVTDGPVDIRVLPRSTRSERDERFTRSVVFVLPDGRFITESWTGEFIAGDPELSATAETEPFAFSARIEGQTMAGSQVRVGDASTTADGEGTFMISVDAAPWPHDIAVVVEDPLGRSVELELEVIGLVDYRGWPWLAVIGVLVAVAGIGLYVRVPRTRTAPEPALPEQPTLEEIEV